MMSKFDDEKLRPLLEQLHFDASNDLGNWHWIKYGDLWRIGLKVSGNMPLDYVYLQRSYKTKNPRCPTSEELIQVINAFNVSYIYDSSKFWVETTGNWCRLNAWLVP